jgi:hypothetical protein
MISQVSSSPGTTASTMIRAYIGSDSIAMETGMVNPVLTKLPKQARLNKEKSARLSDNRRKIPAPPQAALIIS